MNVLEPYNKFFADGQKYGHDARCLVAIGNWHKAVATFNTLSDLATVESANWKQMRVKYRSGAELHVRSVALDRDVDGLCGQHYTHLVTEDDLLPWKAAQLKTLLRSTVVPNCSRNVTYA